MKIKLVACMLVLSLTGCATILSGTRQRIHVKVLDVNNQVVDAQCTVSDGTGGTMLLTGNPGSVVVSKARGGVVINCVKEGYRQISTAVGDNFNPVTLVNVLFWPGFVVDAVSGSYRKFPSHYVVMLQKNEVNMKKGKNKAK